MDTTSEPEARRASRTISESAKPGVPAGELFAIATWARFSMLLVEIPASIKSRKDCPASSESDAGVVTACCGEVDAIVGWVDSYPLDAVEHGGTF